MSPSLVIHGHFYQPPRENPFLDEVETEPSAAPYHDWNQRIERECYRAVVAARVTGAGGRIVRIVNTLEWISFNFGPTLLEWLEREARDTYDAILTADRTSAARLGGHGNAIAQPYHHTILPLASRRDKVTEVRWGMADFRRRFGREPEGMWLPETAVDDETLDVLAGEGIGFTILAPHQVARAPLGGRPGRYRTSSGRTITLCVYNGSLSHGIAFGGMLHDADKWVAAMMELGEDLQRTEGSPESRKQSPEENPLPAAVPAPPSSPAVRSMAERAHDAAEAVLLSAATDGETYGHHHRFGEMALARALETMRARAWVVENFASVLARAERLDDVDLVVPTSWSCAHGIGRWRSNCGCRLDGVRNPSQEWRAPLRAGLERVAAGVHEVFGREGTALFGDPWLARDAYGSVVASGPDALEQFAGQHATGARSGDDLVRARELLEMERDALRMFTSCAWFFDDIAGIEPRQILRYAARAIALAGELGPRLEEELLRNLARAQSNDSHAGTGREVYLQHVRPAIPAWVRIAAATVAGQDTGAQAPRSGIGLDIVRNQVRVTEPRTGRMHVVRGAVRQASSIDVVTEIEDETGTARTLHLDDLPERARHAIRSRLRRAILPRCLTQDELDLLVAGDVTLAGLVRVALLRAVEQLAHQPQAEGVQLVNDLLDLFDQFEARIPFDAQTAFWRIWMETSPARRSELQAIFHRLGFSEGASPTESVPP